MVTVPSSTKLSIILKNKQWILGGFGMVRVEATEWTRKKRGEGSLQTGRNVLEHRVKGNFNRRGTWFVGSTAVVHEAFSSITVTASGKNPVPNSNCFFFLSKYHYLIQKAEKKILVLNL